jgi:hypothetical protein
MEERMRVSIILGFRRISSRDFSSIFETLGAFSNGG